MPRGRGRPSGPTDYAPDSILTRTQAEVVYLRDECGLSWPDIARKRGVHRATVKNSYDLGKKKMEQGGGVAHGAVVPVPEGAPERPVDRADRLTADWKQAGGIERRVDEKALVGVIGTILDKMLFFTAQDDVALANMPPKDRIQAIGTLIDKWQLLRGEPTTIMRLQDIRKLDEVGAMLKDEMERRGLIIDVTPQEVV